MQTQEIAFVVNDDGYTDGSLLVPRFPLRTSHDLREINIAYRIHGDRSKPLIIALGGISAHRGLTAEAAGKKAWWPEIVGPGQGINTEQFCVLSFDYLGGSADTSGPLQSHWPEAARISTEDQAQLAHHLLENLGFSHVHHWVGASYGGMVGLAYAKLYPKKLRKLTVISAAHRSHPMAMAWRYIQREIVALGLATGETKRSLAIARALAMTTYRSPEEFGERFSELADVVSYLEACGSRYAESTSELAFSCLSASIDDHLIDLKGLTVDLEIIGFWEDRLVPAEILKELADITGGDLKLFHSVYGHDAFLKETSLFTELLSS
ncbi:MAG: homoserine O-succinyltransferase MetX [Oligoflexus sp.]